MNEIDNYITGVEGRLIGYYAVSFPVYVVHVVYDSIDTDPFFPLYRALIKYTALDPKHEHLAYFARVIGFESDLIKRNIKELKENGMIRTFKGNYIVTEDAKRKYLTVNSRPTVRVTGAFLVDGKDLGILPRVVYESRYPLSNKVLVNVSAHLPIDLSISQAPANQILELLKKKSNKDLFHLESSGDNFEVLDLDRRYLTGAYAVFYINKEQKLCKDIVFAGQQVQCQALGSAQTYSIEMVKKDHSWEFKANLGYNVSNATEAGQVALYAQSDGWGYLLSKRYGTPEGYAFSVETMEKTKLPRIVLDENLLWDAKCTMAILDDAKRGYIDFNVSPQGNVRIAVNHSLQYYLDFKALVEQWNSNGRVGGKAFAEKLDNVYPNWRQIMLHLGLYEELEIIDVDCFILNRE